MKNFFSGIIALLIISSSTINAQSIFDKSRIKEGDKQFEQLDYPSAIEWYEGVNNVDTMVNIIRKLAEAYRLIDSTEKAEKWFTKFMAIGTPTADDVFYYSQALASNKKYDEANKQMDRLVAMNPNDIRAKKYKDLENSNLKRLRTKERGFQMTHLDINTSKSDFGTSFYKDQVVFSSSRVDRGSARVYDWTNEGFLNLFIANKLDSGQLAIPTKFSKEVNTKYHEGPTAFTKDGNTVYFTRNNYNNRKAKKGDDGTNNLKIYVSTKNENGNWSDAKELPFNGDNYSTGHPTLTQDGNTMYFASNRPGGYGESDIYMVSKSNDTWGSPINLGSNVNTESDELFPFLHMDIRLIFASNGHPGLGQLDLFSANISDGKIGEITNLGAPVNSSKDDFALILNEDETEGYLSSNRPGGDGGDDIYSFYVIDKFDKLKVVAKEKDEDSLTGGAAMASRALKIPKKDYLGIKFLDAESREPLKGANIKIYDQEMFELENLTTDNEGSVDFPALPLSDYIIEIDEPLYQDDPFELKTLENISMMKLEPFMVIKAEGLVLEGKTKDSKNKEPINEVKVTIVDNNSGDTLKGITNNNGILFHSISNKVGDQLNYTILFEKKGYLTQTIEFIKEVKASDMIKYEAELVSIDVSSDVKKLLSINPIYFDLDKSFIRPDAALELKKIVKMMKENPTVEIELTSHTDSRQTNAYNQALSNRRAKSSIAYIVSKGISKSRISGQGYGETRLVNECKNDVPCSKAQHQLNRRTEFKIVKY